MKLVSLCKLILLNYSEFKMTVYDKERILFHMDITPLTSIYHLPMEAKTWDIERISIKNNELHVWVN